MDVAVLINVGGIQKQVLGRSDKSEKLYTEIGTHVFSRRTPRPSINQVR